MVNYSHSVVRYSSKPIHVALSLVQLVNHLQKLTTEIFGLKKFMVTVIEILAIVLLESIDILMKLLIND